MKGGLELLFSSSRKIEGRRWLDRLRQGEAMARLATAGARLLRRVNQFNPSMPSFVTAPLLFSFSTDVFYATFFLPFFPDFVEPKRVSAEGG